MNNKIDSTTNTTTVNTTATNPLNTQVGGTSTRSANPLTTQVGGAHYKDMPIQPVEYIFKNNLQFLEGCIVKRISRYNHPTGKGKQDLQKAIHELELLIQMKYGNEEPQPGFDLAPVKEEGMAFVFDPNANSVGWGPATTQSKRSIAAKRRWAKRKQAAAKAKAKGKAKRK